MASDRPNPLGHVASTVGAAWAAVSGIVSALTMFGILTIAQGDAIRVAGEAAPSTIAALGAAITGVVTIVGGLISAFRTVAHGKEHVTPIADPRAVDPVSGKLVKLVLSRLGDVL